MYHQALSKALLATKQYLDKRATKLYHYEDFVKRATSWQKIIDLLMKLKNDFSINSIITLEQLEALVLKDRWYFNDGLFSNQYATCLKNLYSVLIGKDTKELHEALQQLNLSLYELSDGLPTKEEPPIAESINSSSEESAASLIWASYSYFSTQKKYTLFRLRVSQQHYYKAFVVGNDPLIQIPQQHRSNNNFALIATSCLRALMIASELSDGPLIPKIFLVDNSYQVASFWKKLRVIAEDSSDKASFIEKLALFTSENSFLFSKTKMSPQEDAYVFFKNLFLEKDYIFVRRLIRKTSLVIQDWAHKPTFEKIKNICSYLEIDDIYVYSSNIIAFLQCNEFNEKAAIIEDNIALLKPKFHISTNCEPNPHTGIHGPTQVKYHGLSI